MISSLGFRGVATGQLRICSRATTTYLRSWIESDVLSRLFNQFFPGAGAGFGSGNGDPHDLEFPRRQGDGLVQWNSNAGLFSVITDIGAYHVQPSCQISVGLSGKGPV
jgi:hypothetical protein